MNRRLMINLSKHNCRCIIMFEVQTITSMGSNKMSEQQVYDNLQTLRLQGMIQALQKVVLYY